MDWSDPGCFDEKLDYSTLIGNDVVLDRNKTEYTDEEVAKGKIKGLDLLDQFEVYKVVDEEITRGKPFVDTKWEISWRAGELKCRMVGREYKWSVDRDDVFAPASSSLTSRVVDYIAMKDDLDESDPMCTFVVDCTSAFYQTPEEEEAYVLPPVEWMEARRAAGLSTAVRWQLKKQLPGRRAAGARWIDHVNSTFTKKMNMERYEPMPYFYRKPGTRLLVECHMDDFHGCGKKSEVETFLDTVAVELVVKRSKPIVEGQYQHLKRGRVKLKSGVLIQADPIHLNGVAKAVGVTSRKPPRTPYLLNDRPEFDPVLDEERQRIYRSAVGSLIYVSPDRVDMQRDIFKLGSKLSQPTEHDWKHLQKVASYGASTSTFGVWLKKPVGDIEGVVRLTNDVDTDHAGCKETRRSMTCGVICADGCPLASLARRQTIISLSSGESEFCGMHSINVESVGIKRLLQWYGFRVVWSTRSDSSAARSMALREGVGRVRHMDSRLLYTQYLAKYEELKIGRLKGTENQADIGTKAHPVEKFEALRKQCGVVASDEIFADGVEIGALTMTSTMVKEEIEESTNQVEIFNAILVMVRAIKQMV